MKQCPGCNGSNIKTELWGDWFATACYDCNWQTGFHNSEEESERAWNTRATDPLLKDAEREARSLAMSLWRQYYQKESPNFELCDSAAGIITQINNMIAGIIEDYTTQRTLLKEMAKYIHDLLTKIVRYGYDFQLKTEFNDGKKIMQKYHEQEATNAK